MTDTKFNALRNRFTFNKHTSDDLKLIKPFQTYEYAGETTYLPAVERYIKHVQKLQKEENKSKETQLDIFTNQGLMFPLGKGQSAIPKQMMRSSLFAPITRGRRKAITDKQVATFEGGEIRFTGIQLDQGDLDVLLNLNSLLSEFTETGNVERITDEKGRVEYTRIKFKRYAILKEMGKTGGQDNYKKLEQSLDRLGGRLQIIIDGQGKISGGILGKCFVADDGMMTVDINHDYTKLFSNNQFTFIDHKMRMELKGDFTKWLQGFVSTHTGKSQYSADTLIDLSGCDPSRNRQWVQRQATPAFEQLKDLSLIKWFTVKNQIFKWER